MSNAVLVRDDFDSRTAPTRAQRLAVDSIVASVDSYVRALDCVSLELADHLSLSKWLDSSRTTDLPLLILHAHAHDVMHISALTCSDGVSSHSGMFGGAGGGGTLVAHSASGGSGTRLGTSSAYWTSGNLWQCEPQHLVFLNACTHRAVWRTDDAFDLDGAAVVFTDRASSDIAATTEKINASLDDGTVDEESIEAAKLSVAQALEYVRSNSLSGQPRVMMSDDGVLTLQWRNEALGAALIFTGDGTVSVALKDAKKSYSETLEDVALDAAAPPAFVSLVEAIAG